VRQDDWKLNLTVELVRTSCGAGLIRHYQAPTPLQIIDAKHIHLGDAEEHVDYYQLPLF
jgi:hypothetical protein